MTNRDNDNFVTEVELPETVPTEITIDGKRDLRERIHRIGERIREISAKRKRTKTVKEKRKLKQLEKKAELQELKLKERERRVKAEELKFKEAETRRRIRELRERPFREREERVTPISPETLSTRELMGLQREIESEIVKRKRRGRGNRRFRM